MELRKAEVRLSGRWIFENGEVIEDSVTRRINFLKENLLVKITTDESGWITLYKDPKDGRYWELTYLDGHFHGGGPPSLINITEKEAKEKFSLK